MLFCFLAVLSFALQNLCLKEYGRRYPGTVFSQVVMTSVAVCIVAVIMAVLGGVKPLTGSGWFIAAAFGAFFVLTLTSMTLAMGSGPLGLTVLIQNSSLLVPVVWGVLVWKEELTLLKVVGILLILGLLAFSALDDSSAANETAKGKRKKWLLFLSLAFIGDSGLSVLQGTMARACADTDSVTFTFWTSVFSAVFAGIIVLICLLTGKKNPIADTTGAGKTARSLPACLLGVGVGTAGGNCFSILSLTVISSVVMFPVRMGSLILFMWLMGILIYREKVTRNGLIMLALGLSGIILLNL